MSFVVSLTLAKNFAYYGPPRYYELADGSLSMDPVRRHNGTQIYSAERLLVDIESFLDSELPGAQIVLSHSKALEEEAEE